MRTSILASLAAALAAVAPSAAHVPPRSGSPVVIVGTVRDARNAALPGASVDAERVATATDAAGRYTLRLPNVTRGADLAVTARRLGYAAQTIHLRATADTLRADFGLAPATVALSEVVVQDRAERRLSKGTSADLIAGAVASSPASFGAPMARGGAGGRVRPATPRPRGDTSWNRPPVDREQYDRIEDNPFLAVASNPRSTFSVDVDRASYGNVRRFITQGQRPPADAVRIEELVNYFPYTLPAPRGDDPVAITTEVAPAPWRAEHRLVRIALRARPIPTASLPPSNLVFLIDVSGSMQDANKLPLVKRSLRLLVDELREQDRVAIVVYAGAAGVVLPSTAGSEKARIAEAIDRLEAGGSTAGGEGLLLAYKVARENRIANGVNRVVLATDGDFNVGVSSDGELERLVEAKRAEGTYLTVLGFGTGNYQDAKMEKLAKRGNGNYAYVDDLAEARKTLVHELGATLHTVADDVKLQVEFNPVAVRGFRLIGYEDRLLRDEDFTDDTKDAGDMGAGHVVTALYEIVPVGVTSTVTLRGVDAPRYGGEPAATKGAANELLFVKLRYKRPGESTSRLLTQAVTVPTARATPSADFRFAASVAEFGMLLRGSEHKGRATVDDVLALARGSLGGDEGGYRGEFVRLVEAFRAIERPMAARDGR
jgi:Ca-activated chloride channel family protein